MFLIVRCSPLFEYAPNVLVIITFAGAMTSFFAATTGAFQNDLKRVIAYSTCSQLGYMVFACGISSYSVTMFHLMNHAFFKALLFLSAGAIIHAMHDEQDMRRMGALNRLLPFTYTMTLIGSFALIGFPFLTGYYSKDFILELACSKLHFTGNLAFWLGTISVSFTTFYSYRLLFLTFINKNNGLKNFVLKAHEPNALMSIPLILLAFGSLFVGYLSKDMIIGLGTPFWGHSLFVLTENVTFLEAEYLPYHIKMIPFIFSHIGILVAYNTTFFLSSNKYLLLNTYKDTGADTKDTNILVRSLEKSSIAWTNLSVQKNILFFKFHTHKNVIKIYTFFNQKWHFDDLYNRFIVQKVITFGYDVSFKLFDAGWIAYLGPYGIAKTVNSLSKNLGKLQTGFVYHYAFIIVIAITLFVPLIFLWTRPGVRAQVLNNHLNELSFLPFFDLNDSSSALYFIFIFTFLFIAGGLFSSKKSK